METQKAVPTAISTATKASTRINSAITSLSVSTLMILVTALGSLTIFFPAIGFATSANSQVLFDQYSNINALSSSDLQSFSSIAFNQAQIWGDTIYEGDLQSLGEAQLIQVVWQQQTLNGESYYLITYREPAVDLSQCEDPHNQVCRTGWVQGLSKVSLDLLQVKEIDHQFRSDLQ